jgi:hypothetical protein
MTIKPYICCKEIPLSNYARWSLGNKTIPSGLEEIPLPSYARWSHGGITIPSGVEEMTVPNYI